MTDAAHATLGGRPIELRFTPRARAALARLEAPLTIELELYFSCLLRKRVHLLPAPRAGGLSVALSPRVTLSFRPVMSERCDLHTNENGPPLAPLPTDRATAFLPSWVSLDFRRNRWQGDFGYPDAR
jgi:hypothetical protein